MNLIEAKQLLRKNGYKLIKEDAYMDAMEQELEDIQTDSVKSGDGITLTYPKVSDESLEVAFEKFNRGTANVHVMRTLSAVTDLYGVSTKRDEVINLEPGEKITFTNIPDFYGRFKMIPDLFKQYTRQYGKEIMKKLIALACFKDNFMALGL